MNGLFTNAGPNGYSYRRFARPAPNRRGGPRSMVLDMQRNEWRGERLMPGSR